MHFYQSKYKKPYTSVPEQVRILQDHGLEIEDIKAAEKFLRACGYYRFSGYAHFFKEFPDKRRFRNGTNFSDVKRLYTFDEELKQTLLEGLAEIEVSLRFHIGHRLGRHHPFAHRIGGLMSPDAGSWRVSSDGVKTSTHREWLDKCDAQESISGDSFVRHFRSKYRSHLPVWAATEIISFGTLCKLYYMLEDNDAKLIAARFGLINRNGEGDTNKFSSWINHLRYLRNVCAHRGRAWNRTFDATLSTPSSSIPELMHWSSETHASLYESLCAMKFLLARIAPESDWSTKVTSQIVQFSRSSGIDLKHMGFPEQWHTNDIWSLTYEADLHLGDVIDAIDDISCSNKPDTLRKLYARNKESERKKWLNYLGTHNALYFHQVGPQKYYPDFQFRNGDIRSEVADVNELLIHSFQKRFRPARNASSVDHSQISLAVQSWWLSPSTHYGFLSTPLIQLENDPASVFRAAKQWTTTDLSK